MKKISSLVRYIISNDLKKHDVTIALPKGRRRIRLSEAEVRVLMVRLDRCIREWG